MTFSLIADYKWFRYMNLQQIRCDSDNSDHLGQYSIYKLAFQIFWEYNVLAFSLKILTRFYSSHF